MTRSHDSRYTPPADPYAALRCVNCQHLRYRDEKRGDRCRFCPCAEHVTPKEASDATPTP